MGTYRAIVRCRSVRYSEETIVVESDLFLHYSGGSCSLINIALSPHGGRALRLFSDKEGFCESP